MQGYIVDPYYKEMWGLITGEGEIKEKIRRRKSKQRIYGLAAEMSESERSTCCR